MDMNATLIGQFITFAILVWFTMKYVWPPITQAIHEREKKIAAGLDAALRSKRELEMAQHKALDIIRDAKNEAAHLVEQARQRSAKMIDEAKEEARQETERLIARAQDEIAREIHHAKDVLRQRFAELAITGAEKIIQQHLTQPIQTGLLDDLITEL